MDALINVLIVVGAIGFFVVCYVAIRDYRDWMLTPEDQPTVVAAHPAFAEEWRRLKRNSVPLWIGVAVLLLLLVAGMLYLTDAQNRTDAQVARQARLLEAHSEDAKRDTEILTAIQQQLAALAPDLDSDDRKRLETIESLVTDLQATTGQPSVVITPGEPGEPGIPGLRGQAGPPGPPGADGVDGTDGVDGATGPAGADGAMGPAGADGATGATGADGATGATGPAGADGATGPVGPAGETGATGPAGADGASVASAACTVEGQGVVDQATFSYTFTLTNGTSFTFSCTTV